MLVGIRDLGMVFGSHHFSSVAELDENKSHHARRVWL